ncbi:hypothetical protein JB92DRAFT_2832777 [Gautieria morchelliformis]|nr:hypothetical protein JB92DRAFT_2832777 [Gautieria morchelliformis]
MYEELSWTHTTISTYFPMVQRHSSIRQTPVLAQDSYILLSSNTPGNTCTRSRSIPATPTPPGILPTQGLGTLAPNQIIPQSRTARSPTPIPDPGDPIAILNTKGINEGNKADISALAAALESFGDFKHGTSWNLGKEGAAQLIAITKLLREASLLYGANRLATNNDLQKAVLDIKEAVATSHGQPPLVSNGASYAAALGKPRIRGQSRSKR